MSEEYRPEFRITLEDSLAFARLSGDWNPLHVDPIATRRTQFGGTVVHGIHALLKAIDAGLAGRSGPGFEPEAITATFQNPIQTDGVVSIRADPAGDSRIRISAECSGRPAFSMTVTTVGTIVELEVAAESGSADWLPPEARPRALEFPPGIQSGQTGLGFDSKLLRELFPRLARAARPDWIADLLASTRIVGMEYPGLDSIFSGLKLARRRPGVNERPARMSFEVIRLDPRFRMARLAVRGSFFEGTLETFFRPPAVAQRTLASIMEAVERGRFRNQRALVVGGSRGLGEVTAKILLAGSANVTISYARGLAEAQAIAAEAEAQGMSCGIRPLDLSCALADSERTWLADAGFTHLYYFASPHIEKNATGCWDQDGFARMGNVYVRAFAEVTEAVAAKAGRSAPAIRVLYPSTVFLDTVEPGFAEYCAAKAAGEALGAHLERGRNVLVSAPRLPRMRTDQTSSLTEQDVEDPCAAILEAVARLDA